MNDISDTKWASMTDGALLQVVGRFVRHHRLNQNITQSQLAGSANISRSTLSLLENGEKITLPILIQVLRVLDKLHILDVFQVKEEVSPLAYLKMQKKKRKRARNSLDVAAEDDDIGW